MNFKKGCAETTFVITSALFMLVIAATTSAFNISVSSPQPLQYNVSEIDLALEFSDYYHSWSYFLNKAENPVCTLSPSEKHLISMHDNGVDSSFNMYGSNDAHMRFGSSLIPQVLHLSAEICFLLNDKDDLQENSFMFRVNDGNPYSIVDDASLPVGSWTWKCVSLEPDDFAPEYNITMWYQNRSAEGGVYLANSDYESGSSSYYNYDTSNPPNASDENISWLAYSGDTDWIINLSIITYPIYCPLNYSFLINASPGINELSVNVSLENGSHASKYIEFEHIAVNRVSVDPVVANVTENIYIQANITAGNVQNASARIKTPNLSEEVVELYDDGNHGDLSAGDNIFGNIYFPLIEGNYEVSVEFTTSNGSWAVSEPVFFDAFVPFHINISSDLKAEHTDNMITLPVSVSHEYDSWGYYLNSDPYVEACSFSDSGLFEVNRDDGILNSSWTLNGDNDAQIRFDSSLLPIASHQSVEACFYLYDNDWQQENNFMFRVNDGNPYSIVDDASFPAGEWVLRCVSLDYEDISDEYNITMWYSNRSLSGGMQLAVDNSVNQSISYYESSSDNSPDLADSEINWTGYSGNNDWMVSLYIITEPVHCPLNDSTKIIAQPGLNQVDVWVNRSPEGLLTTDFEASDSSSFWIVEITDADAYPLLLESGDPVNITAEVLAPAGSFVSANITNPDLSVSSILLYDDGMHGDGLPDDRIFGNSYLPYLEGMHYVSIELETPLGTEVFSDALSFETIIPFAINITPVLEPEYNITNIPFSISVSGTYDSWGYYLNNNSYTEVCTFTESKQTDISYNSGIINSSWNLNGNNDAHIRFDSSVIPDAPQQSVEACFYLYDNDWQQENSFMFRVNDGNPYSIVDDASLPVGSWTWKCVSLEPDDFAPEYNITMWYENRTSSGGVILATDRSIPGSDSYYDMSSANPPDSTDHDVQWISYGPDIDWMVNLSIVTEPVYCPLSDMHTIDAVIGQNNLTVFANRTVLGSTSSDTGSFWVSGISDVSVTPEFVLYQEPILITSEIIAEQVSSVTAVVTAPYETKTFVELYDDGTHGDSLVGDMIYSGFYEVSSLRYHDIDIMLATPNIISHQKRGFFSHNAEFDIVDPQDGDTVTSEPLSVSVSIPTNISSWGLSLNSGPEETLCSYYPAVNDFDLNFTEGNYTNVWLLSGNNDAEIRFSENLLPKGKHRNVSFCFYLYDTNASQEESLMFMVNSGERIYEITDDENIPVGEFTWVCKNIDPSDFSSSYRLNFWYSNRSGSGGLFIGTDNSVSGTTSYFDISENNVPDVSGAYINWYSLLENEDWMVKAVIDSEEYICPEFTVNKLDVLPGFHNITLFMTNSTGNYSRSISIEHISVDNISTYPKSVKPGNTISVRADAKASKIEKVEAVITYKNDAPVTLLMYDDGFHNDGLAGDGYYGVNFTPVSSGLYNISVILTTEDNVSDSAKSYFTAARQRVAVIYSETTDNITETYTVPREIDYINWITSVQHELVMAGIPFEVISQNSLKDMYYIQQYDAMIFPSFRNVLSGDRETIVHNLETAVKFHGIGMLAFGSFMTHDETNAQFSDIDEPLNRIFNVQESAYSGDNVTTQIIVNDPSHPSAWRFTQGDIMITTYNDYYQEFVVFNTSEEHAYPYFVNDLESGRLASLIIASDNMEGRAFFCPNAHYVAETAIGRDALLWLLYGDRAQAGIKMTDKNAIFVARTDADVSFDPQVTSLGLAEYLDIMSQHGFKGGWYLPVKHSNTSPINWVQLKDDYENLLASGHEIGSHSITHPGNMNLLTDSAVLHEMTESKDIIQEELGIFISGFANPGESPVQSRLWKLADRAGYEYYSPLDDGFTKGLGYIDDKIGAVSLQVNMLADYQLIDDENMTPEEVATVWIDQYDYYYGFGDGIAIVSLWHDYHLNQYPGMFESFVEHVESTDAIGISPAELVQMFKKWRVQDFSVNFTDDAGGKKMTIKRSSPDVEFAQVTLPPESTISDISGSSNVRNTSDGKSMILTFNDDTIEVIYDAVLWLEPIDDTIVTEGSPVIISLNASYLGTGTLAFGTDAFFGNLDHETGMFTWTPNESESGIYEIEFNVTDGTYSDTKTAKITVIDSNQTGTIVNITLYEGWNLISIPVVPDDSSILSLMQGCSYNRIWEYMDEQKWNSTDTGLSDIDYRKGYWIDRREISENCTISVAGSYPEQTEINVNQGWSLVGFPSSSEINISLLVDEDLYERIWVFDNKAQSWNMTDMGLMVFSPGKGYFIDGNTGGAYNLSIE